MSKVRWETFKYEQVREYQKAKLLPQEKQIQKIQKQNKTIRVQLKVKNEQVD